MSNAKGKGFLKVVGILMIIGGAIGIIAAVIMLLSANSMNSLTSSYNLSEDVTSVSGVLVRYMTIYGILAVVTGVVELIAGILGCKNAKYPEKATVCIVFGFISLVIAIAGQVIQFVSGLAGTTSMISLIGGILLSVVLPVLYLIGAFLNKKSASL